MNEQKLISIQAENFKRLRAVSLSFKDGVTIIGGQNSQGKSSLLDAIQVCFFGKKSLPIRPIKDGEKESTIVGETTDLTIKRVITDKGPSLKLESKDGHKFAKPEEMIKSLFDAHCIDPVKFLNDDNKKQVKTLKEIAGIDFEQFNVKRHSLYHERTLANGKARQLSALIDAAETITDPPDKEVSVTTLLDALVKAEQINGSNDDIREELAKRRALAVKLGAEIGELQKKLNQCNLIGKELAEKVNALKDEDAESIKASINSAESNNKKFKEHELTKEYIQDFDLVNKESAELTDKINQLDKEKTETLAAAKFPVDGLSFNDDTVLYEGLPFEQASQSIRLNVAVSIGLALNPKLRLVLIRDGSLLDKDSLATLEQIAKDKKAQIILERVGQEKGMTVIIEDGEIQK